MNSDLRAHDLAANKQGDLKIQIKINYKKKRLMIINAGVSFVYFFDVPSARFSQTHDETKQYCAILL